MVQKFLFLIVIKDREEILIYNLEINKIYNSWPFEGEGNGTRYPLCIDVDINDLIKDSIYLIDCKLVKEVDLTVYNKIFEKLYLSIDNNLDESV